MSPEALTYLAQRLERCPHIGCVTAMLDVRRALQTPERFVAPAASQALAHMVWGLLDEALEDVDGQAAIELEALRREMAGVVYAARIDLGWLERSASAPLVTPGLHELGVW